MKHYFIQQKNRHTLTLFFAGWGMDEQPFMDYTPTDSDLLICYDYRSLYFDAAWLKGYERIRLVGWSMGVWAASQVLSHIDLPLTESIAVNGTMTPVHDANGIPKSIFEGTLNGLNDATLKKFLRRMCGSSDALETFWAKRPQRSVQELKEELYLIGQQAATGVPCGFVWDKAVVGNRDLIFAATHQNHAWQGTETKVIVQDLPHYSEEALRKIICNI